jgi:hypothetical protein
VEVEGNGNVYTAKRDEVNIDRRHNIVANTNASTEHIPLVHNETGSSKEKHYIQCKQSSSRGVRNL